MVISVIIPVYNAEESIEKCLDSIKNQTWKGEFEIIVINDGSPDNGATRNVALSYGDRIRYFGTQAVWIP